MKKNEFPIESDNNEVKNKEEAIKKLKKERLKIKQESETFARKIVANAIKRKSD
jgi:uncharacterized protein YdcH (DUF465 family)